MGWASLRLSFLTLVFRENTNKWFTPGKFLDLPTRDWNAVARIVTSDLTRQHAIHLVQLANVYMVQNGAKRTQTLTPARSTRRKTRVTMTTIPEVSSCTSFAVGLLKFLETYLLQQVLTRQRRPSTSEAIFLAWFWRIGTRLWEQITKSSLRELKRLRITSVQLQVRKVHSLQNILYLISSCDPGWDSWQGNVSQV